MSDPQRLMKQGLLGEMRQKLKDLEHRAYGIIQSIQIGVFVESTPFALDADRLHSYTRELQDVVHEANELRGKIDELEDQLGVR